MHRRNVAENSTQTFKGHFKSIICRVATDFPLKKWDTLLPQAELTCNLLHQANIAPNVSAQAYIKGPHDFNQMQLAPLGCVVQIHEKNQAKEGHGQYIQWTDGILEHLQDTTDVTMCG